MLVTVDLTHAKILLKLRIKKLLLCEKSDARDRMLNACRAADLAYRDACGSMVEKFRFGGLRKPANTAGARQATKRRSRKTSK